MNPYMVLGVSESATQEEIRKAYLELVKKYHPDKYMNTPMEELANEKLKEVNEAYDTLTKRRAGNEASSNGAYNSNTYSGNGGAYSGPHTYEFARVRAYLNQNDIYSAKALLDSISTRNAEWYYLYGVVYLRQGWYDKAREYMRIAHEQEPGNAEYRNGYESLNSRGNVYSRGGFSGSRNSTDCTGCDVCSSLLCADCCCECMGGDLIRCC